MTLTLRRTNLATVFAYARLADWTVFEDGQPIGRIHEEHAPSRAELAWSWSTLVVVDPRAKVLTSGKAPTFAIAKMDFQTNWEAWTEWVAASRG
jgi:hypothetical protein